jgi:4-amino-4-deoxy-L-arabinose transferase-like glycosyltransferase
MDWWASPLPESTLKPPRANLIPWLLVALVVVFVASVRLRLLQIPLERDEGEYAYAGQLMLQGIPPYQFVFNMKFPGTYAAYAAIMAVFGETIGGIHLGFLLINAGTIVLIYLLGRRLFSETGGVAASAAYALLSLDPAVLGTQAHATHFVVAAAIGGTVLLLRATDTGRLRTLFWSGLLYGVAVLMKQHGILFAGFAVLVLLRNRQPGPISIWRKLIWFGAGLALPLLLTGVALWMTGVFDKFWFWTIRYAREYTGEVSISEGLTIFKNTFPRVVGRDLALWIAAAVGLVLVWWKKRHRRAAVFATVFLVVSFLAVCPGFYFRQHYFVLMLPAVALLAGAAVSCAVDMLPAVGFRYAVYGLYGVALLFPIALQRELFFQMTPREVSRAVYGPNPFPEAVEVAAWIRSHSAEGSRIGVLGSEPEIPFYAGRHSATGYIYMYPLMEPQPFALTMQEELVHNLETARPEYMVVVSQQFSWLRRPQSPTLIFDWWDAYHGSHYKVAGVVEIISAHHTEYQWDDPEHYRASGGPMVIVYKRI